MKTLLKLGLIIVVLMGIAHAIPSKKHATPEAGAKSACQTFVKTRLNGAPVYFSDMLAAPNVILGPVWTVIGSDWTDNGSGTPVQRNFTCMTSLYDKSWHLVSLTGSGLSA